ncbi:helix-turn-helix domain-containing protein [Palleronia sp.]|uniref:helix-turn-helix domain-containing protein n=1 Tax=Palleronia sp. TaxID=1940284 RepID=UPI0035C80EAF
MQPAPTRNARIRVQRIRSPLTRVGYALPAGVSHLLLLSSGTVQTDTAVDAPRLWWRPKGTAVEMLAEAGTRATLLSIPEPALAQSLPAATIGQPLRQELSVPLQANDRMMPLIDGLEAELATGEAGADVAARHYLALLLTHVWRRTRAELLTQGATTEGLAERFVQLVTQHARQHWTVAAYARAIGVSRDRLRSAVKGATGLSPQAYLHRHLIREASELLNGTATPIGTIAFRLGFADPAYFTRFFSRAVGTSPSRFRASAKRRPNAEGSYAAWP